MWRNKNYGIRDWNGTFVLPVLQRADRLNMRLLKIDVKTPETGVKTKNGVSLWIDSVVTIQVYSENSTVLDEEVKASGLKDAKAYIMSRQQAAISNFLGMNEQGINDKVNDVLQGNLREIVSDMTVDQILTNRKQMAVSVIENARPDLAKMGLEVVTFNVQDIRDAVDVQGHNHGVIEAIGIEQEELVKKQAEIARAQAARDVACAKADAEMAANAKEVEAQTAIAKRNNELQLAKAKLKAEADKAAADADAAGQIQMNLRAKEIKEAEADAEIANERGAKNSKRVNESMSELTTAFYGEYVRRMLVCIDEMTTEMRENANGKEYFPDIFHASSSVIADIFEACGIDLPDYVRILYYNDYMGDESIGRAAIEKIELAWQADPSKFRVDKKQNRLIYSYPPDGPWYELKYIADELPNSLEAEISGGNQLIMNYEQAQELFGIKFRRWLGIFNL